MRIGIWNSSANLIANGYTRTGYAFAGWATTSSGVISYVDGAISTATGNFITTTNHYRKYRNPKYPSK